VHGSIHDVELDGSALLEWVPGWFAIMDGCLGVSGLLLTRLDIAEVAGLQVWNGVEERFGAVDLAQKFECMAEWRQGNGREGHVLCMLGRWDARVAW
jgi:hypothetical protein